MTEKAVRERPILMDSESVKGVLSGAKTQTRRVIVPQPTEPLRPMENLSSREVWWGHDDGPPDLSHGELEYRDGSVRPLSPQRVKSWRCPYASRPGDRLWVRETWFDNYAGRWDGSAATHSPEGVPYILYRADGLPDLEGEEREIRWRPSIFLPRRFARLVLEVVSVGVERVNAISVEDAQAEGVCAPCHGCSPGVCQQSGPVCTVFQHSQVLAFQARWDAINGKRAGCAWRDAPWVWCCEFRRVQG